MKATTLDLAAQLDGISRPDLTRALAGPSVADMLGLTDALERAREMAIGSIRIESPLQNVLDGMASAQSRLDEIMQGFSVQQQVQDRLDQIMGGFSLQQDTRDRLNEIMQGFSLPQQAQELLRPFAEGVQHVLEPVMADFLTQGIAPHLTDAFETIRAQALTGLPDVTAIATQSLNSVQSTMRILEEQNERHRRMILGAMTQVLPDATAVHAAQAFVERQQFMRDMWGDIRGMIAEVEPESDEAAEKGDIEEVRDPKIISAVEWLPPQARAVYTPSQQYVVRSTHYLSPSRNGATAGPTSSLYRVGKVVVKVAATAATVKSSYEACVWLARLIGRCI